MDLSSFLVIAKRIRAVETVIMNITDKKINSKLDQINLKKEQKKGKKISLFFPIVLSPRALIICSTCSAFRN